MNKAILDTDILSAIMRQESLAIESAQVYLENYPRLSISIITQYEILRGLHAKLANTQIEAFQQLCMSLEILPITDAIIDRASKIYGELYRGGNLIGDADILIAATCLVGDLDCITNNTAHFSRVQDLVVGNWLRRN